MSHEPPENPHEPDAHGQEGLFDAQMSLPLPFVSAPEPFSTVVKRNGREETFERRKIANAIFQAAKSIGGSDEDLADSLARAVTIYLTKQLGSHAPTVDHIHDAVERVLIQMTHVRTAFAYARYRDRRARIRRLREGDMRLLLGELEEARNGVGDQPQERGLFVRTSSDTLTSWNRDRIVEALVRETGLDAPMALVVATEVEGQLASANIETLTSSLVRELVAARLVAHGLGEFRERHRRLGVPLYDCERIIKGLTDATTGGDPVATDRVLAGAVKKEYALTQIHAPHVSDAHLEGAIHLHNLDKPDRLHQLTLSPAMVAQFGVGLPGAPDFASPPRNAATFLAQLAKATASFQACVATPLRWDAVNYHFAPYVRDFTPEQRAQFAQMMVYEFAYRALAHGGDGPGTELRFSWAAPEHLAGLKAAGPEGVVPDCTYGDLEHPAQQLAWAFLDVLARSEGLPVVAPAIGICLGPDFFQAPGSDAFLAKAAELVESGYRIRFYFRNLVAADVGNCPWKPIQGAFHAVALNLPRIAFTTGKEAAFMALLDQRISLIALALSERYDFLEGLLDRGLAGPLGLLAITQSQQSSFNIGEMSGLLSVSGLNEAVSALIGVPLHQSDEARQLGQRIVARIQAKCAIERRKRNMAIAICGENHPEVGRRFAERDMVSYPKTMHTAINIDRGAQDLAYSHGVALRYDGAMSPFEAVHYEGDYHAAMDPGHIAAVSLPNTGLTTETIASFLKKAHTQTAANGIVFCR